MCMTVHLLKPSLRVGGCIAAVLVPIKVSLTLLRASIVSLAVSIITVSRNTPLDAPFSTSHATYVGSGEGARLPDSPG